MRRLFVPLLLLLAPCQYAWSIPLTALPAQLQACVGNNTCFVETSAPVVAMGSMEAYLFSDTSSATPITGYALRYSLLHPSARYVNDTMFIPFSGDVWLTVQDTYDLAGDSNRFTIYTDTVKPQPVNLLFGDSNGLDISIDLTNAALLSGAGSQTASFLDLSNGIPSPGNMMLQSDLFGTALLPCLADECLASATLNLVHLNYVDRGNGTADLVFVQADPRTLLYEITNGYFTDPEFGGSVDRQSYYVASVPLPATAWLLLSGLVILGGRMRRVRG